MHFAMRQGRENLTKVKTSHGAFDGVKNFYRNPRKLFVKQTLVSHFLTQAKLQQSFESNIIRIGCR